MNKFAPLYAVFTAVLLVFSAACNSTGSDDNEPTVISSNVLISSFTIQENDSVMENLDSVGFTIDVNRCLIYNADSLPKGTKITRLVPSISLASSTSTAIISISGATTMNDTTYTYTSSSTDSIDFTGKVYVTVNAADGYSSRKYEVKVNVHQLETDSLCWDRMPSRYLPGVYNPNDQKTTECEGSTYNITYNGTIYNISKAVNLADNQWTVVTPQFSFTPDVRSLTATSDALYILDGSRNLYKSTDDGTTWTATGNKYNSLIAGYGTSLLAVKMISGEYYTAILTSAGNETLTAANADFPVKGFSNPCTFESKWGLNKQLYILGGITASGNYIGTAWGFDGANWEAISVLKTAELSDMTIFPYYYYRNDDSFAYTKYPVMLATGGRASDGTLSKTVYISYNNGVDWKVADTLLQLPSTIASFYGAQAVIEEQTLTRVSQPVTQWQCPYIYLFGGYDINGTMQNRILVGVVNRLSFRPIY